MGERPTSVRVSDEHFYWLAEAVAYHPPVRGLLRWLQAVTREDDGHFVLEPPDGDFSPLHQALDRIQADLAQTGELEEHYEALGGDMAEDPVAQRELDAIERVVGEMAERADRVDILRNIVFYPVGPDFPAA